MRPSGDFCAIYKIIPHAYAILNQYETSLHSHHPFRIFWFSVLLTLGLGSLIFSHMGVSGLWLFTILVVLEVTFSFDNAVINSKVLAGMSQVWQKVFLTVGIFVAVFVVRFILPIAIVMIAERSRIYWMLSIWRYIKPVEYGKDPARGVADD